MKISVVSPYGVCLEAEADFIKLPGKDGEIGVLPGHSSLISTLSIGELVISYEGEKQYYFVPDGVSKINQDSIVLLVSYVEPSSEIDFKRAESSLERAVKRLTSNEVVVDSLRARQSKLRAQARLDILNSVSIR